MQKKVKKLVFIYGTRPEIIKLMPVISEAKKYDFFEVIIINSGQHSEMLRDAEKLFGIRPNYNLRVMSHNQKLENLTENLIHSISKILIKLRPNFVIVQGDTTTAMCSALSAFYLNIQVAHIEAGLRSFDLFQPFPEEFNRKVISIISSVNFAPTTKARENLLREGIADSKIFVTGNTIIDAVKLISAKHKFKFIKQNKLSPRILVTAHRRENHKSGIKKICDAIKLINAKVESIEFVWPVHPNPNVSSIVHKELKGIKNTKLLKPVSYLELLKLINSSFLIWTDSGGIQEEVTALKKPVLILRNVTERPEVVTAGFGIIVGTDPKRIVNNTILLLKNENKYLRMTNGSNPFGNGDASKKILSILKRIEK